MRYPVYCIQHRYFCSLLLRILVGATNIVQENLDQPVNATLLRGFYNTKATLQHIRRKVNLFLSDVQARNKSHGVLPRSQN